MARKSRRRRSLLKNRPAAPEDTPATAEVESVDTSTGEEPVPVSDEPDAPPEAPPAPESIEPPSPPNTPEPESVEPPSPPDTPEPESVEPSSPPDTSEPEPSPTLDATLPDAAPFPPSPRFRTLFEMGRGHVAGPVTEPLLQEWEIHALGGMIALASGFVLVGAGGLFGLWLVLQEQMFEVLFGW